MIILKVLTDRPHQLLGFALARARSRGFIATGDWLWLSAIAAHVAMFSACHLAILNLNATLHVNDFGSISKVTGSFLKLIDGE